MDMDTDTDNRITRISLIFDQVEAAARTWAAAASTAGAAAPPHIADVLVEQWERYTRDRRSRELMPDLAAAALEGTRRAQLAHEWSTVGSSGFWPSPRGLDVAIRGGRADDLVWRSDRHVVVLAQHLYDRPSWTVTLHWVGDDDADLRTSGRAAEMLASGWSWRDSPGSAADGLLGAYPHNLAHNVRALGLVETDFDKAARRIAAHGERQDHLVRRDGLSWGRARETVDMVAQSLGLETFWLGGWRLTLHPPLRTSSQTIADDAVAILRDVLERQHGFGVATDNGRVDVDLSVVPLDRAESESPAAERTRLLRSLPWDMQGWAQGQTLAHLRMDPSPDPEPGWVERAVERARTARL